MFRFLASRPRFVYPIKTTPKTAVLRGGLRLRRPARHLEVEDHQRLLEFAPAAVAGSLDQLRTVGERGLTLTHAVVVFTAAGAESLCDADRDWLWNTFRVPVFEQVLDPDGTLIAYECEAHSGLHWIAAAAQESMKCGCGAPGLHSREQFPYLHRPEALPSISRNPVHGDLAAHGLS